MMMMLMMLAMMMMMMMTMMMMMMAENLMKKIDYQGHHLNEYHIIAYQEILHA